MLDITVKDILNFLKIEKKDLSEKELLTKIKNISVNSKIVKENTMFVPLKREKTDGAERLSATWRRSESNYKTREPYGIRVLLLRSPRLSSLCTPLRLLRQTVPKRRSNQKRSITKNGDAFGRPRSFCRLSGVFFEILIKMNSFFCKKSCKPWKTVLYYPRIVK